MVAGNLLIENHHSSAIASVVVSSHLSAIAALGRIYHYCLFDEERRNYYCSCLHFDFAQNYHGLN